MDIGYYKDGGYYKNISCPICDAKYDEKHDEMMYDPPIGVCEHYYCCSNCGYNEFMAYSPTYYSFDKLTLHSALVRLKNIKKVIGIIKQKNYIPSKIFVEHGVF